MREHLLDRIAISLGADVPRDFDSRVAAVEVARRFQDEPNEVIKEVKDASESTTTQVRSLLQRDGLFFCQEMPNTLYQILQYLSIRKQLVLFAMSRFFLQGSFSKT